MTLGHFWGKCICRENLPEYNNCFLCLKSVENFNEQVYQGIGPYFWNGQLLLTVLLGGQSHPGSGWLWPLATFPAENLIRDPRSEFNFFCHELCGISSHMTNDEHFLASWMNFGSLSRWPKSPRVAQSHPENSQLGAVNVGKYFKIDLLYFFSKSVC